MKKAFTLIELLVVIAIIGILAAMVLVSLGSARTKAKDTRVTTAVSGYRSAAEMYFSDNSSYGATSSADICTVGNSTTADSYGLYNLRKDINTQTAVTNTATAAVSGCSTDATTTSAATKWSIYTKLPSAGSAAFPLICSDSTGQVVNYKAAMSSTPTLGAACPAS